MRGWATPEMSTRQTLTVIHAMVHEDAETSYVAKMVNEFTNSMEKNDELIETTSLLETLKFSTQATKGRHLYFIQTLTGGRFLSRALTYNETLGSVRRFRPIGCSPIADDVSTAEGFFLECGKVAKTPPANLVLKEDCCPVCFEESHLKKLDCNHLACYTCMSLTDGDCEICQRAAESAGSCFVCSDKTQLRKLNCEHLACRECVVHSDQIYNGECGPCLDQRKLKAVECCA